MKDYTHPIETKVQQSKKKTQNIWWQYLRLLVESDDVIQINKTVAEN